MPLHIIHISDGYFLLELFVFMTALYSINSGCRVNDLKRMVRLLYNALVPSSVSLFKRITCPPHGVQSGQ